MSDVTKPTNHLGNFVKSNQPTWSRLEYLLEQLSYGTLHKGELDELGAVYRKVSSNLSYAQTYFPEHETTEYLNQLVIRAHNLLYGTVKKGYAKKILRFFTFEFPYLFYQRSRFFFVAASLLFAGFLLAFVLTCLNKDYASYFLPPEIVPHANPEEIGQQQWNHPIVSSEIMVNNIQVAFMCFAWGALLGIGTVWSLFLNGMLLGALAALYHLADGSFEFWAFIWPHGVIELTAIFISGAAGLSLAYRVFVPGDLTRRHALIEEGKVTIKLMLGVIPMFMVAGVIEGYLTPAPWPHWTKYLIALITFMILIAYFGWPFFKYGIRVSSAHSSKNDTLPV